ncbi:MAG: hypothetical protein ACE5GV_03595 [Candidatus Scalindua sp.]
MDPKVVHKILKEPGNIMLGGEEKEITVHFSDIEKFSFISEKLQPAELIELLNEYLSERTYELAGDQIETRDLNVIRVVSKETPLKVYELIEKKGEIPDAKRNILNMYKTINKSWQKN